ncbi:MAG: ATP-binding cassette domain-containing protein [Firmicutes bacterium]|nr:ATP-binding cassette domain-containing protein [Bacillota bacterium]
MIEVSNLVKNYGKYEAVKNISFKVEKGEVLGFLGPNGAGKSTTMNIITGYISPSAGEVKIGGFDILKNPREAKKRIGYLPEIPPVYMDMTVLEYLEFAAELKDVKRAEAAGHIESVMERVKIVHVKNKLIKNLSKGYRQRVGLAQALIGNPEVLILDEPTVGLDPKQIIEIREVIKHLSDDHTIILSSHILSEVSAVCSRVMIINKGEIVASDSPEQLSEKLSRDRYRIRLKGDRTKAIEMLRESKGISYFEEVQSSEAGTWDFIVEGIEGGDVREAAFLAAASSELTLLLMKSEKMSLEEIFLQVTESVPGEEAGSRQEGEK